MYIWLLKEGLTPVQADPDKWRRFPNLRSVRTGHVQTRDKEGERHSVAVVLRRTKNSVVLGRIEALYLGQRAAENVADLLEVQSDRDLFLVFRTSSEPRLGRHPGRAKNRYSVREVVYRPDRLPDPFLLLTPVLATYLLARIANRLKTGTRFAWVMLSRYQMSGDVAHRIALITVRLHLFGLYVIVRQCSTMLALDSQGFAKAFDEIRNNLAKDHQKTHLICCQLAMRLPKTATFPNFDDSAISRLVTTWQAKATRGSLVVATIALVFTVVTFLIKGL